MFTSKPLGVTKVIDPSLTCKSHTTPRYLHHYKKNVYRRVRHHARRSRDTLVYELKVMPLSSVCLNGTSLQHHGDIKLEGLVTLQSTGIGCVILWLDGFLPKEPAQWCELRDPELIDIELASDTFTQSTWRVSLLARYLIALIHEGIHEHAGDCPSDPVILEDDKAFQSLLIERSPTQEGFLLRASPLLPIEVYPFAFIQFDLPTAALQAAMLETGADIRLALCGDTNWRCKRSAIINSTVTAADTSTRDSIFWFVNSDGCVKICSNQLETAIEESFTAVLLETDIALTLRFFLQRMNALLAAFTRADLTPSAFASLRYQLLSDFESYSAIDNSHKDTTRDRVEQYKAVLHIAPLYRSVLDRFEMLAMRLETAHSFRTERHHVGIALIFGFFSALSTLFNIYSQVGQKQQWSLPNVLALSLGSTSIATLTLWLIIRIRNRNRYNLPPTI